MVQQSVTNESTQPKRTISDTQTGDPHPYVYDWKCCGLKFWWQDEMLTLHAARAAMHHRRVRQRRKIQPPRTHLLRQSAATVLMIQATSGWTRNTQYIKMNMYYWMQPMHWNMSQHVCIQYFIFLIQIQRKRIPSISQVTKQHQLCSLFLNHTTRISFW